MKLFSKIPTNNVDKSKSEKIDPKALHKSYLESIETPLEEKGAIFFDETRLNISDDYLILPAEITDVPSKDLGEYLNAFTQQKVYLRTLLGRVDILVEEARRVYLEASDPIYRKYSFEKLSETAKDRLVNANEAVKPAYHKYVDMKKKYTLIEISISNIEDIIFMLSREVTRRTGDYAEEARVYNTGGR